MNDILRIHEKVLDYLLNKRKKNSDLFFATRKINKGGRLDKGYWFLGNDNYVNISFWEGIDWKEKINNIGFVIDKEGYSSIELSAQDSPRKVRFLENVAKSFDGFYKHKSKNKWFKENTDRNYIKNLEYFIANEKPIIDKLIDRENPYGIKKIDTSYFTDYSHEIIQRRKKQIEVGNYNKVVRLCWNEEGWKFPSGSKGKSNFKDSYEYIYGFGHEEWLFDKSKLVDDYHYAFLQPLNVKSEIHVNKIYNLNLFSINNLNKKYFVGEIENVECISKEESERVFKIYKENGWIYEMKNQVEKVNGIWGSDISSYPELFFNVRFKFENVKKCYLREEISDGDINITTNHYKLLPKKDNFKIELLSENDDDDESEGNKKNTDHRKKVYKVETSYDPYHDKIQNALFDFLNEKSDYKKVKIEKDRVDIKAKTSDNKWHYFEIKTDCPKLSIRKAIGQIMEYAYYPNLIKAEKLIIVADENPDIDTINYLNFIREKFKVPITYRSFDLEKNILSEDF